MKDMTVTEHLEELRKRIIRICLILFLAFGVTYSNGERISEFLLAPLRQALGPQGKIVYLGLFDKVISDFQVSFWTCILLSSPLWFWQIWAFVRPGLHEKEAKVIRPFVLAGFVLFIGGILFGYYVLFPLSFKILTQMGVKDVEAMIGLKDYLSLSSKILVILGLIFQLPIILLILGFMGMVTKYSLRGWRRYIYVGLAIFAAVVTPTPDPFTMLILWVPLIALYELGILAVALLVHPYLEKQHT
ncbi:MAG: twin-arginine translocase subunit TatC [Bacteriovoracaceae bacterium]